MRLLQQDKGFSLVEMMVVIAIVGLMTSAVVLAMPSKDTELLDTLRKTGNAMGALARRSVMTGRIIGVRFSENGFDTLYYGDNGWIPANDILKPEVKVWPTARLTALEVADGAVDASAGTTTPHIWFLPTGETLEFSLQLASSSGTGQLISDLQGGFEVSVDE